MNEDELYKLAQNRIDRRNRRWILWGVNIAAFLIYFGAFVALGGVIPLGIGLFIAIVWGGLLVLHGVILGVSQTRDEDIEKETIRLREATYEKPKRLELNEDGELVDGMNESSDQNTDSALKDLL